MRTPGILTKGEALEVLTILTEHRRDQAWRETNVNMASATVADDGTVFLELFGWTELHVSVDAFARAYGLEPAR